MAKIITQIILAGTQVVYRAFARALKQEIEASQEAARMRGSSRPEAGRDKQSGISLDEAKQILDVTDLADIKKVNEQYQKLFQMNESGKGGSFYLQSKVYRAKERLDLELQKDTSKDKAPDLDK